MHLHDEQKAPSGADVSTLIAFQRLCCCVSHLSLLPFTSRLPLAAKHNDCRALPRVAAATAQKISLSCVAIVIASLMRSFADEQMHFPSPLCQLADSIP